MNSSDNHSSTIHKPQKKNHHSDTKKSQLALPMLSFKTASQQLQKISLASALHSKRKVDAKGIFSNVKSGKYHTNAAPHEFAREDELAVTPSKFSTPFAPKILQSIFPSLLLHSMFQLLPLKSILQQKKLSAGSWMEMEIQTSKRAT